MSFEAVRKYVEQRANRRGLDPDLIHGLDTGAASEAELTLTDLRAMLAEIDQCAHERDVLIAKDQGRFNAITVGYERIAREFGWTEISAKGPAAYVRDGIHALRQRVNALLSKPEIRDQEDMAVIVRQHEETIAGLRSDLVKARSGEERALRTLRERVASLEQANALHIRERARAWTEATVEQQRADALQKELAAIRAIIEAHERCVWRDNAGILCDGRADRRWHTDPKFLGYHSFEAESTLAAVQRMADMVMSDEAVGKLAVHMLDMMIDGGASGSANLLERINAAIKQARGAGT